MSYRPLGVQIARHLRARDVETVFGIPGVHNIELYRGLSEAGLTHILVRHEQGDGERAFVVRQRDAHEMAARPDVQGIGLDAETAIVRGRDLQLLVAVVQPFAAFVELHQRCHLRAQRRARAIGTDERVEGMHVVGGIALERGQA